MKSPSDHLYGVTQLGSELGVTPRTIRFYESKGLIAPQRVGNNRVYTARDRARMILILRGKKLGFTLREIREYLDLYDADPTHAKQIRLLLDTLRGRILRLEEQRAALLQVLAELRNVETQAQAALAALDAGRGWAPMKTTDRSVRHAGAEINGVPSDVRAIHE